MVPPKIVFIVPYRDREEHYKEFSKYINNFVNNKCLVFYIHQCDTRPFNRGALKNIGFLYVKKLFPMTYTDITLVFHDIDTIPLLKLNYDTVRGNIKHFYGVRFTLGGIVSIKCCDFESVNGFPNLWSWGFEDNALQKRVRNKGYNIDRSVFFEMNDFKHIRRLQEVHVKDVNIVDYRSYLHAKEGIKDIHNLKYEKDGNFINIHDFSTSRLPNMNHYDQFDTNKSNIPFKKKKYASLVFT